MIGFDPAINLGSEYHEKGKEAQLNPPMIPELYGGLAATQFFAQNSHNNEKPRENGGRTTINYIGRHDRDIFGWDDLPPLHEKGDTLKNTLGTLMRFCFAYKYVYGPALAPDRYRQYVNETWFKKLIGSQDVDLASESVRVGLKGITEYCDSFLQWAASMEFASSGPGMKPLLFNSGVFANFSNGSSVRGADLKTEVGKAGFKGFKHIVHDQIPKSLSEVFTHLTYEDVNVHHKQMGVPIGMLYEACR